MKKYLVLFLLFITTIPAISQWSDQTYRQKNIALRDTLFFADIVNGKYVATSIYMYHDSVNNRLVMAGTIYAPSLVGGGGGAVTATLPLRVNTGNIDLIGLNSFGTPYSFPVVNAAQNALSWNELFGTIDQITITKTPSEITFSLPQSINTNSDVSFNSVTSIHLGTWSGNIIPSNKLGSGISDTTTYLRGDGSWVPILNTYTGHYPANLDSTVIYIPGIKSTSHTLPEFTDSRKSNLGQLSSYCRTDSVVVWSNWIEVTDQLEFKVSIIKY